MGKRLAEAAGLEHTKPVDPEELQRCFRPRAWSSGRRSLEHSCSAVYPTHLTRHCGPEEVFLFRYNARVHDIRICKSNAT
jgi:hypothetical protein